MPARNISAWVMIPYARLAVLGRAPDEKLHREQGLAAARAATDQGGPARG